MEFSLTFQREYNTENRSCYQAVCRIVFLELHSIKVAKKELLTYFVTATIQSCLRTKN